MTRDQIADVIAPMLADGRTAGSDGVPRVGRATRKKAMEIADRLIQFLAENEDENERLRAVLRSIVASYEAKDQLGKSDALLALHLACLAKVALEQPA